MADTEIPNLTAITAANLATGDLFVVVDVSDTTQDTQGTAKIVTKGQIDTLYSPAATATGLSDHLADTSDAHDASAISFAATGSIAATDVQAAVAEVATEAASALSTHEADTTNVHGIADTSALLTTSAAPELIRDTMGTALVAGANMTITVNDGSDTITLAAAGGSSSAPEWWTGYTAGQYASASLTGANMSTVSFGGNQILFVPFRPVATTTFDRMRIYTSQVGSGEIRMGIYNANGTNGGPGTVLLDGGTVATTGTAGDRDLTISQSLTGGTWYWLAVNCNNTHTISIYSAANLRGWLATSPAAGTHNVSFFASATYGALPNSPTLNAYTVGAGIVLRAA